MTPARATWFALAAISGAIGCTEPGRHIERAFSGDPGSAENRKAVVKIARTAKSEQDRARAVWALGAFGDAEYVPVLREALADKSQFVRTMAAEALGRCDKPEAVPDLIICLHDPDHHVRRAAVTALQRINSAPANSAVQDYFREYPVGKPEKSVKHEP